MSAAEAPPSLCLVSTFFRLEMPPLRSWSSWLRRHFFAISLESPVYLPSSRLRAKSAASAGGAARRSWALAPQRCATLSTSPPLSVQILPTISMSAALALELLCFVSTFLRFRALSRRSPATSLSRRFILAISLTSPV